MADDHELWERICSRDANVFEAFYRDNAVRLCAYLRQIVGNAQAAEDVIQETFTQIWRSPNGFRPELERLGDTFSGLRGNGRRNGGESGHELPKCKAKSARRNLRRWQRVFRRSEMRSRAWVRNSDRFCGCAKSKGSRMGSWLRFCRFRSVR